MAGKSIEIGFEGLNFSQESYLELIEEKEAEFWNKKRLIIDDLNLELPWG